MQIQEIPLILVNIAFFNLKEVSKWQKFHGEAVELQAMKRVKTWLVVIIGFML